MSQHLKTYRLAAIVLVCAQAGSAFAWGRGFHSTVLGDLIQSACLLSGLVFALSAIPRTHGRVRAFWTLLSLGFGLWLAFQFLWDYFEIILRHEVPNPFVGDILLFLHVVPMMAALALRPHAGDHEPPVRLSSLDFLLLFMWWLYLYLFAVIPWQYVAHNEALYDQTWNVLYLTEKAIFLLWLGVLWIQSKDSWRTFYGHWLGASMLYVASSYIANIAIGEHRYYTGSLYDVPLVISLAWLAALGLLSPKVVCEAEPSTLDRDGQSVWSGRLAMLATLSLPLLLAWSSFVGSSPIAVRTYRLWLTIGTMIALGFLVFVKQHVLDQQLLQLLSSSQTSLANLERAQQQLIQSEKLASLGQLVAGSAHELNNPLTAVIGYGQMLAQTTSLTPGQQSLTDRLLEQANRTKTLVSGLLNFAEPVPTEKTEVNINSVVQMAVKLSRPDPRARTVRLDLTLAPDVPPVRGDSNQLLQVFLHMLRNAMDAVAGRADEIITIRSDRRAESVIVEVWDNGPGIDEPQRVFDPFYTTKPVGKGTGLGLSACHEIIQQHGGRIWCQNRPGGGAVFQIELPLVHSRSLDAHSSFQAAVKQ